MSEGRIFPRPAGEDTEGFHMAMDPLTGKIKWQVKLTDFVTQAGMLATDGGLVCRRAARCGRLR